MRTQYESTPTPRQYAEQVLSQSRAVLKDAVGIAFPETPDLDPVQAFPKAAGVRAESPDIPELTENRKATLATKAAELGFGSAEDVSLSEQGLIEATAIIEGGQPHKMLAEAKMVTEDKAARPKAIIICGSPHRELKNAAEVASAQKLFGRVGKTEYDVAGDVARALPGFTAYPQPNVLPASYDINNDNTVSRDPTGQFQAIGHIDGVPVVLMQINRRDLGEGRYDRQPGNAAVIGIIDAVTRASGDETSPLVHVTSGTYRPSRTIGVALAGLSAQRLVGIATYGNDRLNIIKGTDAPAPIDQLPSELHEMAIQTRRLQEALSK